MLNLARICLTVVTMAIPCFAQDSLYTRIKNDHLLSLDISGDEMTASGRAQMLARPLIFNDNWALLTDITLTFEERADLYLLLGCAFNAQLTSHMDLELSFSSGCAYQKNKFQQLADEPSLYFASGAAVKIVKEVSDDRELAAELEVKSKGQEFWYLGKLNIPLTNLWGANIDLGARAEKYSIAGPQLQLSFQPRHVVEVAYWLGYGYNSEIKEWGLALGLVFKSLF